MGKREGEDRITVDIRGWRPRLQEYSQEPGQSTGAQVRYAIATAIEFWAAIEAFDLAPPRPGKMREWLMELSQHNLADMELSLKELIDTKGSLSFIAEQASLPVDRIVEIRNSMGPYPNPEEINGLAKALEIKCDLIERLVKNQYQNKRGKEG